MSIHIQNALSLQAMRRYTRLLFIRPCHLDWTTLTAMSTASATMWFYRGCANCCLDFQRHCLLIHINGNIPRCALLLFLISNFLYLFSSYDFSPELHVVSVRSFQIQHIMLVAPHLEECSIFHFTTSYHIR